jgi:hypothetical protein
MPYIFPVSANFCHFSRATISAAHSCPLGTLWFSTLPTNCHLVALTSFSVGCLIHLSSLAFSCQISQACANGHSECVSALIDAGATFQPNGSGNTPLHWASANGHLPVVSILLDKYAQVDT